MDAVTAPSITASLSRVNDDDVAQLEARRVALGMPVSALAEQAGVDRGRLAKVLKGEVRARSAFMGAVDAALTRVEEETGMDAPPRAGSDLIEFDITGDFGVHLVVKGPVGDADILKRQVVEIIREIRRNDPKGDTPE